MHSQGHQVDWEQCLVAISRESSFYALHIDWDAVRPLLRLEKDKWCLIGRGLTALHIVQLVRRIEVPAKDIKWSGGGDLVAIMGESSFYVLRYDRDAVEAAVEAGTEMDEDGIEEAFELQTETSEAVRTGESCDCVKGWHLHLLQNAE